MISNREMLRCCLIGILFALLFIQFILLAGIFRWLVIAELAAREPIRWAAPIQPDRLTEE